MKTSAKMRQWERTQTAWTIEQDRINFLKTAPLPVNPPSLMKPVKVRVLKPTFCIKGERVEVDSILSMPYCDAVSLQVLGKAIIIE
ncbi:MAG: hypothetical protein A2132_06275 [Nitrospirae bacterium RBG_16_43_11]|nr:MAG: hypothetical protein A2132_06275 [Nitrospirae bacterium RBG_16_43_11]